MAVVDSVFLLAENVSGVTIASVRCEKITEREASVLGPELTTAAEASGHKLVLDMEQVVFLASAGIGTLVSAHRDCKAAGGKMAVCNVSPDILEVLKLTRLHKLFTISKSKDAAIKAVS